MQSFTRKFHFSDCKLRDLSKFVDKSKKIPQLRSSPTIYNTKSSASNDRGYMRAKIPAGLYFNPAQSSATGSINSETFPVSFLPKDDSRREFIEKLRANDKLQGDMAPTVLTSKSTMSTSGKQYHLRPQEIEQIRRLREENPEKHTRKKLARQFNVSPLFISIVTNAPNERIKEMDLRLAHIKSKWHEKRVTAREDRKKRKELWYRA